MKRKIVSGAGCISFLCLGESYLFYRTDKPLVRVPSLKDETRSQSDVLH